MTRLSRAVLLMLGFITLSARAEPPHVVASIMPVHSLVAAVMQGVAEPLLLLTGSASPHDYSLRPSEARALQRASVVFRIGPVLERFLDKPIGTLGSRVRVVNLVDAPGVALLPARRTGRRSARAGDTEQATASGTTAEAGAAAHTDTDTVDEHLWLSPGNAAAMLRAINAALADVDPDNTERYAANMRRTLERLDKEERRWRARLAPVRTRAYVVFHDAYRYFERDFELNDVGAVAQAPGRQPSAGHLRELLETMRTAGARCLFREPQFRSGLIDTVVESTGVQTGVLDPVGAGIEAGADAWFELIDANVESLVACLSSPG